jgi:hypothetical protein
MSKKTALVDEKFSYTLADYVLLQHQLVKPLVSNARLYCVYVVKVTRKAYTHKYGYTSKIWERISGLAGKYALDQLLQLYLFRDEKTARDFERRIKSYVQTKIHKRGGRTDSFRARDNDVDEMIKDIAADYLKHDFASAELLSSADNYIEICNKFIEISKKRLHARPKIRAAKPFRRTKSQINLRKDIARDRKNSI